MSVPVAQLVPGARTVIRRRGLSYVPSVLLDHVPPRVAYRLLRAPGHSPAMLRLAQATWATLDRLGAASSGMRVRRALAAVELDSLPIVEAGEAMTPVGSGELPAHRVDELDHLLNAIHRTGLTGMRHSMDRLVVAPNGRLAFAGARRLRVGAPRGVRFMTLRDLDREAANARFGLSLLTEAGVRRAQLELRDRLPEGWFRDYAPIDFGGGVSVGMFLSTDSGTGRWEFLNRDVVAPLVSGRRVLDLGSNNGSMPLMMARAGARGIIGVEQSPALAEGARLNHRILEWRDMRTYSLRIHVGDMRDFLAAPWGRFDVVTAFCSLYYLPADDMAAVVRKAADMGATLVLQANNGATDIPAARAVSLRELMIAHGYPGVTLHERDGFARPLLVGSPASGGARPHDP